ncbi:MAG: cysteine desulfurase [Bdellovibrionaceae bacterium]|nr:cysteine desulfurase [Pseudobdellovibrionaceae bacterium]
MSQQSVRCYLDHNATTPIDEELMGYIGEFLPYWGNPSSIYTSAREPKRILRETRRKLAELIGSHPLELIFTSGGSEANNLALKGLLEHFKTLGKDTLVTSAVEHPSVLNTVKAIAKWGWNVEIIPVNRQGELDIKQYQKVLATQKVGLVSFMAANNETGVIFPIKDLCQMAHEYGALFHCDAVQFFGKKEFCLKDLNVDLASFSAHKFYALKGCGILYCRKGLPLESLIHGGGQERSRRAGTENILAIAALGFMLDKIPDILSRLQEVEKLRDHFEAQVKEKIADIDITAHGQSRLCNTSHLIISGVDGENMLINLDLKGFEVSTGAACSAGSPEPSPVLLAMGISKAEAQSSLRVSLGKATTLEHIESFVQTLVDTVEKLRELSGYKSQI